MPYFILALLLLASSALAADHTLLIDDFEQGLRPQWQEKRFKGATSYRVVPAEEGHCLQAESAAAASGLVLEKAFSLHDYPVLAWRWKVDNTLERGDARRKDGDDYPARVYVVFPHWFPPKTRSINYIWANRLAHGAAVPNPYFANAIMVAVQSGPENAGRWMSERRNVLEDYRNLFGEEPPQAGVIAIMTDTDNTGERAIACYDDIWLEGADSAAKDPFIKAQESR